MPAVIGVTRGWSIRRRIAVLSTLASLILLTGLAVAVYLLIGEALIDQLDQLLAERSVTLVREIGDDIGDPAEVQEELIDEGAGSSQVARLDGQVVAASGGLSLTELVVPPDTLTALVDTGLPFSTTQGGVPYRVVATVFPGGDSVLLLAQDLRGVAAAQRAALVSLVGAGAVAALLTGVTGALVAGRGLRPLTTMVASARTIHGGALDHRLPEPGPEDEVAELARTLNAMLDRLAEAIDRERRFTADASHELRTPLAILRGEVELVRSHVDGRPGARLDSALEEADRLAALVDDLLVLARADAGTPGEGPVAIDVRALADATAARFATLAARRGVEVRAAGAATLRGDRRGVERAVANLVDNAVRHSPGGGLVTITCEPLANGARVVVADAGPGVAPDRLGRLFERFSRTDDARTGGVGGTGLGLAIVAAVAAAHGGHAEAHNRPTGGLTVVLELHDQP